MEFVIRTGQVADHELLCQRLITSFSDAGPTHHFFQDIFPETVRADAAAMSEWLLAVTPDGDLAAGLQVIDRPTVAGDVELSTALIGNVFCYQPFRRQGLMGRLLREANARMSRNGVLLSFLDGLRPRYARYGWETAGTCLRLWLTGAIHPNFVRRGPEELIRWRDEDAYVDQMHEAYMAQPFRASRTREQFALLLQRQGPAVWIEPAADRFAYAIVQNDCLLELVGAPEGIESLLGYLVDGRRLSILLPHDSRMSALMEQLDPYVDDIAIRPLCMLQLHHLKGLLTAYRPLLKRRLQGHQGAFSFAISEREDAVTIKASGDDVSIADGVSADDSLTLPVQQMTRVLFGPTAAAHEFLEHPLLRLAFPLPVFWHQTSH